MKCLEKDGNFVSFACFVFVETSEKSVFVSNHETIIFQDMLDLPPNRRLRMGFLTYNC